MRGKFATYSVFSRSVWLVIAVCCLVFCGPVKRIIELRNERAGITTSPSAENKLRTCYREKKDIAQLAPSVAHQSPDNGLGLFAAASFIFSISLFREDTFSKLHYAPAVVAAGLPLYLRHKRLQV